MGHEPPSKWYGKLSAPVSFAYMMTCLCWHIVCLASHQLHLSKLPLGDVPLNTRCCVFPATIITASGVVAMRYVTRANKYHLVEVVALLWTLSVLISSVCCVAIMLHFEM